MAPKSASAFINIVLLRILLLKLILPPFYYHISTSFIFIVAKIVEQEQFAVLIR